MNRSRVRCRSVGGRRWSGIAPVLALLTALLTACTGTPDRTAEADAITAGVRALPGVQSAAGDYSNDYTAGTSYSLRVELAPDVAAAQVDAVAALYFSQLGRPEFDGHTGRLKLKLDDSFMSVFPGRERSAPPLTAVSRWFTLTGELEGPLSWTVQGRTLITHEPATGLGPALETLRAVAPDLQAGTRWRLRSGATVVSMDDGYLDADSARLAADFAASGRRWAISSDPAFSPAVEMTVKTTGPSSQESTARADLRRIAALDIPVLYTLEVDGGPTTEVLVGGCRSGGSDLQQRLSAEFGTC